MFTVINPTNNHLVDFSPGNVECLIELPSPTSINKEWGSPANVWCVNHCLVGVRKVSENRWRLSCHNWFNDVSNDNVLAKFLEGVEFFIPGTDHKIRLSCWFHPSKEKPMFSDIVTKTQIFTGEVRNVLLAHVKEEQLLKRIGIGTIMFALEDGLNKVVSEQNDLSPSIVALSKSIDEIKSGLMKPKTEPVIDIDALIKRCLDAGLTVGMSGLNSKKENDAFPKEARIYKVAELKTLPAGTEFFHSHSLGKGVIIHEGDKKYMQFDRHDFDLCVDGYPWTEKMTLLKQGNNEGTKFEGPVLGEVSHTDGQGTKRWTKDGKLHRVDGPAVIWGKQAIMGLRIIEEWHQHGKLHRIGGPAITLADGSQYWYRYNVLHREDGPAIEEADGHKVWYFNDEIHNAYGPAVIYPDSRKEWWVGGFRHRIGGPAIECACGKLNEWWQDGVKQKSNVVFAFAIVGCLITIVAAAFCSIICGI